MTNLYSPLSIYLHIPFCKHRCAYCDFNAYANQESLIPEYVDALIREINFVGVQQINESTSQKSDYSTNQLCNYSAIKTIFFGGGTPSLLSPKQFDSILKALRKSFTFTSDVEITIEANPGTVTLENLRALREMGINRISYGVQSTNMEELRILERAHNFFDVIEAITNSRKAGFDNLNFDLIYGLPEQTLQTWKTTLARIVDLHPEHISAYALTLEHGTPFGRWSSKGLLPIPDPDLAAEMYECAEEFLDPSGYTQYEISNWALDERRRTEDEGQTSSVLGLPPFVCCHNLQYWRSLPYLGFGAGAHGYANGYRYSNVVRIKTYIDRLTNSQSVNLLFPLSPATVNHHKQTIQDDISDYMINNLRLTNIGVVDSDFKSRFRRGLMEVFPKEIEELIHNGLLEKKMSAVYRLTKRGRLLGNQVFLRFV